MPTVNAFLQNQEQIAVSTAAKVIVNGNVIGVVQSLEPSQDRGTTAVRGIGTGDRILTRIWGLTDYKLNVTKLLLFKKNLVELFGYDAGFRMLSQLRTPIDFHEILMLPVANSSSEPLTIRETIYKGFYMTSYTAPRSIGSDIIITETAAFEGTYIYDPTTTSDPFGYDNGLNPS